MKKLFVLVMIVSVSFCFAGDYGLFQVGPTLGIIQPEELQLGSQIGAKANVGSLMDGKIGLYPVVNYWTAGHEDLEDYSFRNIKIGVDGHYDLSEYFDGLYAGAGLSLNMIKTEWEIDWGAWGGVQKFDHSDTELGITVLVGYNLEVSGKPLFVEANYDLINDFNTIGVKAGMYFDLKK